MGLSVLDDVLVDTYNGKSSGARRKSAVEMIDELMQYIMSNEKIYADDKDLILGQLYYIKCILRGEY